MKLDGEYFQMKYKLNVEICAATNILCSYCLPVCDHRLLCDECHVRSCGANFDGWCRQPYLMCWMRSGVIPEYAEVYRERIGEQRK